MPRETTVAKAARAGKIIAGLKKTYPDAHCELNYSNPLELLIATILSAQCTDKRVNIVTAELFKKYRSAADFAVAPLAALEPNVVLGNAFNINVGVVVDTHVARLSQRLGLSKEKDPKKIEPKLMKLVPQGQWTMLSHWLIWHGRRRCFARNPDCENCAIKTHCPRIGVL